MIMGSYTEVKQRNPMEEESGLSLAVAEALRAGLF